MDKDEKNFIRLTDPGELTSMFPISIFADDQETSAAYTAFTLGQNFPNPFLHETTIPFHLVKPGDVTLRLFNPEGKNVASISCPALAAGHHTIFVNLKELDLPVHSYRYQLEVKNTAGHYHDYKIMTPHS